MSYTHVWKSSRLWNLSASICLLITYHKSAFCNNTVYLFIHLEEVLLTLCMLGNFSWYIVSADFFPKSTFLKISFRNTIRVSNNLDPDQARHFVGPDLDPKWLRNLWSDVTGRQRVIYSVMICLSSKYRLISFVYIMVTMATDWNFSKDWFWWSCW